MNELKVWLRQKIGLVTQEPMVFATAVQENISFGVDGGDVTKEREGPGSIENGECT
jgi:ABC-type multidrug transport system fused ATPase/permease subunit